jgi:glycerophosphoryl diester phosphodiesterase
LLGDVRRPTPCAEVIAHRGASAHACEHTLAAYDLALAQGADAIELDVRSTADGELVVVHDATLLRTARDPRRVDALTRRDLAALPTAGRPLALADVVARYGRSTGYLLELKDPTPTWERRVVELVHRHGLAGRVVVQSFDVRALRRLHESAPWLPCASLHRRPPARRALDALASFAAGIGVRHQHADPGLVAAARERGLAVRAWTVNSPGALARVAALGVDGVITDVPDLAVGMLRRPAILAAA